MPDGGGHPQPEAARKGDCKRRFGPRTSETTYGPERLQRDLAAQGVRVGVHRIKRIRRQLGLRCRQKRRYRVTTDSRHALAIAANVLGQCFRVQRPHQAWVSDIAYVATDEGWLYPTGIKDLHSGRIVGYAMADRPQRSSNGSRQGRRVRSVRDDAQLAPDQTRRDRIAPVQIYRLKTGVGDRARRIQGLATPRADRRVMRVFLIRVQHLGSAHPRSAGLFAGFTCGWDRRRWGRCHFRWLWPEFAVIGVFSRHLPTTHPLPRGATTRRTRAVLRPLVQTVQSLLDIRE